MAQSNKHLLPCGFLWVMNPSGLAKCLWLEVFHDVSVKLWSGALLSSEDSPGGEGGESASKLTLVVVDGPWSLNTWASPQGSLMI